MASRMADLVTALNTTRSTGILPSTFFCLSTSSMCQEMASPSRSGSVARISLSAPFTAAGDVLDLGLGAGIDFPDHGEIVVRLDRAVLGGQVADMAEAGQHLIVAAQILIDGFGLGGGFDDENVHTAAFGLGGLSGGAAARGQAAEPRNRAFFCKWRRDTDGRETSLSTAGPLKIKPMVEYQAIQQEIKLQVVFSDFEAARSFRRKHAANPPPAMPGGPEMPKTEVLGAKIFGAASLTTAGSGPSDVRRTGPGDTVSGVAAAAARPVPIPGSRSGPRAAGAPVWRMSSSISTGAGPRAPLRSARGRGRLPLPESRSGGGTGAADVPARRNPSPSMGRSTASTSSALSVSVAPSRIRRLAPLARGSSGEPGTAKISRPCSSA